MIKILRRRSSFKLARVLGLSKVPGKTRVQVWSANSRRYSNPQAVRTDDLDDINEAALSARHRAILRVAREKGVGAVLSPGGGAS